MDAVADPVNETIVVKKSAQVGWTEIINNVAAYFIHQDPSPILVVQPTVEMGEAWSRDRLAPMLRDSPELRGIVAPSRGKESASTLLHKEFPGGRLTIAGANSAASLASRPIRVVLLDEVDRYPASAGSEGDPISLAVKRTNNFWNRRKLMGSTPTLEGKSRIDAAFQDSDKRYYFVACPHCSHTQKLVWTQVKWINNDPTTALYHCLGCGVGINDAERWAAVRYAEDQGGGWRASAPFQGVAGFHVNELMSTWRKLSDTVGDFLLAKNKTETLKTWINTALGETWQEQGDAPDWERLSERREDFQMGVVPDSALTITAGTDVQDDRIETDVWGWEDGLTSWLIDHIVIQGAPRDAATWKQWEKEVLGRSWPSKYGPRPLARVCVDTGGRDTAAVYGHLRALHDPRVSPTKGVEGWNKTQPVSGPTYVDVQTGSGKKLRRGLKIWTIAVSTWKSDLYRRLWLNMEENDYPPGWVHIPKGAEVEWVKQLVAEQLQTKKDGHGFSRQEWAKLRERNEALDMAVLARSALTLMGADRYGPGFWDRLREDLSNVTLSLGSQGSQKSAPGGERVISSGTAQTTPSEAPAPPPPPPAPRDAGWLGRGTGGWLRGR